MELVILYLKRTKQSNAKDVMGEDMRQRDKKIFLPILMLTGIVSIGISAQAAGESVGFGSESYRWELDVPAQIGYMLIQINR